MLSSPPARGPQFAPAPPVISGTNLATGAAADLLVDVAATPNRPGQNFVTATILNTQRPAPAKIRRVSIIFTRGARRIMAVATRVGPSRWQVGGTQMSVDGDWRIAVAVERPGLARATYATPWVVSSPLPVAGTRPVRYSQRPLQPILSALAFVLAVGGIGAAGVVLVRRRIGFRRTSLPSEPTGGATAEAVAAPPPAPVPPAVSASSARTPRPAQRRASAPARGRRTRRRARSRTR
jgi:hypothetical protein